MILIVVGMIFLFENIYLYLSKFPWDIVGKGS